MDYTLEAASQAGSPWCVDWEEVEGQSYSKGGQGKIVKVRRRKDLHLGALKVLHPHFLNNHERRQRMVREVVALRRLHSVAGVTEVIDENLKHVADIDIPLYFITDWIEGITLQHHAGGSPRSFNEAIAITAQLARTIQECHKAGVLHRDIKPDNIILEKNTGKLIIVDFGIAWITPTDLDLNSSLTELGQELGNRFLRIPDMAPGKPRNDGRTDVAFLVGILFFILTGNAPRLILDEKKRKPHEALASKFPRDITNDPRWERLRRIFHVGFELSIDLRFQSAAELLERLEEIAEYPRQNYYSVRTSDDAIAAYKDLLTTEIAKSFLIIEESMLNASRQLENDLEAIAVKAGLRSIHLAGRARVEKAGRSVMFSYDLVRTDAHEPRARLTHKVELLGETRSLVSASYTIDGSEANCYYRGPSADVDRLTEEMLVHTSDMFADCVAELHRLLEKAIYGR